VAKPPLVSSTPVTELGRPSPIQPSDPVEHRVEQLNIEFMEQDGPGFTTFGSLLVDPESEGRELERLSIDGEQNERSQSSICNWQGAQPANVGDFLCVDMANMLDGYRSIFRMFNNTKTWKSPTSRV